MPANASEEIKTIRVNNKQKNGDIYILERQIQYDPNKKYNRVISTKLISKIPKGTTTPVPTRPKRNKGVKGEDSSNSDEKFSASRMHTGMMDIIDHLGKASGIDADIYENTDIGTAQKILSLARYLLATNGQTFPGITVWQYNHALPYEDDISEDIYHDLFEAIGRDESLQQNFFANRCADIHGQAVLAYDSTTISTYSANQPEARQGFNKSGDGLNTIKLLTLYSIETRQPVAFTKQPGHLPDVVTIENALKQLSVLGIGNAEIVTDNGYYSEKNLSELLLAHFDFITLVKTSIKWVKKELDQRLDKFRTVSSACPFDPNTHGITVMLMHEFTKTRKYAGHKKGTEKGDQELFTRRIYLHLYFNPSRQVEQDLAFDRNLLDLRTLLEAGTHVDELSEQAQETVSQFLQIRNYGNRTHIVFDEDACAEEKKYHGFFTLVSNCEKDPFECLQKYRRRETIESFFKADKQHADGARARVWDSDTLRGRMFVQFVALGYYEYLSNQIRTIKNELAKENGDPVHDSKSNLAMETKLKTWLSDMPIYLILQWFDTVEEVNISSKLLAKRWTTEMIRRDHMFLERLGISTS